MNFLEKNCTFSLLDNEVISRCVPFSCGDGDLDDFFSLATDNYRNQLLGNSYCYLLTENPKVIICAFTLSNSSMDVRHLPGSRKKKIIAGIPREKHLSSYPAMLIGRLGVNKDFGKKGIGSELIRLISSMATEDSNLSACRYLTVDAYNNEAALKFYETNGFGYLFSTEQQEKEYIGMSGDKDLKTRLMYSDLIRIA
jgi:ribosomal protein S18 acetylase RimI-like enzyme